MSESELLAEQMSYYRARAGEYDDWFYRRGRYDRGPEANAGWLKEVATVEAAIADLAPLGDVVELAAGTGLWTRWLATLSDSVTAVDASEEVLAINAARVANAKVERVVTDLFSWSPPRRFDTVFFGFWLSHIPPERLDWFWNFVAKLLVDRGRFFFVDSRYNEHSTATDHQLEGETATSVTRRLDDGREFRIVKVFHDPQDLEQRLAERGWHVDVRASGNYFIYGSGRA